MLFQYSPIAKCDFCDNVGAFNQDFDVSLDPDEDIAWICIDCLVRQMHEIEELHK